MLRILQSCLDLSKRAHFLPSIPATRVPVGQSSTIVEGEGLIRLSIETRVGLVVEKIIGGM